MSGGSGPRLASVACVMAFSISPHANPAGWAWFVLAGSQGIIPRFGPSGQAFNLTLRRFASMPFIITDPCIGTKDTACVDVCPVDCIHPRKDEAEFAAAEMLYIDPDVCIQCGNCEPACPVTAIFTEETIPDKWKHYLQVNADWYKNRQT